MASPTRQFQFWELLAFKNRALIEPWVRAPFEHRGAFDRSARL